MAPLSGMIDIHSHILPGLDDGARDLEESVRMCSVAAEDGITAMVASPHHLNGAYVNHRENIAEAVIALREALRSHNISLTILPGSDLHLASNLLGELKAGRAMTINDGGKFILLELPGFFVPAHVKEQVFRIRLMGITPIITHPERNNIAMEDLNFLYDLIVSGSLLQVTAGSITGDFGRAVKSGCKRLMDHGMVHIVSSDAHDSRSRPPILSGAFKALSRAVGVEEARMAVTGRPESILAGEAPSVTRPEKPRKSMLHSFFGLKRRK